MMSKHILVIDDEPDIRQLLSITISRMGMSAYCVENIQQSYQALAEHNFELCLTDLRLPDGSGLDVVQKLQDEYAHIPVIVITAHGSMDIAVNAMKLGAFDFINKPVDLHHLRDLISNALSSQPPASSSTSLPEIIGESDQITKLKDNIIKVSRSQAPVFIVGESGSGKELVAKAIHNHSSRKDKPFIAVNCGAVAKDLMESEFFGHTKGSFTGAHQDKQGLFQAANGGSLFLDEVADLPLDMQVKLLRALQEKTIRPIGSATEVAVDVRILSATHKNLADAVLQGDFRNDLFYRINVIEIPVPPLRQRSQDIALLSRAILEKIAKQNSTVIHTIKPAAVQVLQGYTFPGNVRELENILERACALAEDTSIDIHNLSLSDQETLVAPNITPVITQAVNTSASAATTPNTLALDYDSNKQSIDEFLDVIEKDIIISALDKNRWNRTATAKELGLTFRSLRYRLKKLQIEVDKGE